MFNRSFEDRRVFAALDGGTGSMAASDIPTGAYTPAGDVATDETQSLIASDKVEGTAVYNSQGDRLGSVFNFMVNKRSGQVAYANLSFGGFLGIGERYFPLPWKALTYDTRMGGFVVDIDKSRLEAAPSYTRAQEPDWTDPVYGRRINDYYGFPAF